MSRTKRFRFLCGLLAASFLLVAVGRLLISTAFFNPLRTDVLLVCNSCDIAQDPVMLLGPEDERRKAWRTPGIEAKIVRRAQVPQVERMLVIAQAITELPFFLLFVSLAMAFRSFAAAGFNRSAVRWLKRSALASVGLALAQPVAQSIRWTAFSPITHGRELAVAAVEPATFFWTVLLAVAVWVSAWALEEAVALQQDLEEYV